VPCGQLQIPMNLWLGRALGGALLGTLVVLFLLNLRVDGWITLGAGSLVMSALVSTVYVATGSDHYKTWKSWSNDGLRSATPVRSPPGSVRLSGCSRGVLPDLRRGVCSASGPVTNVSRRLVFGDRRPNNALKLTKRGSLLEGSLRVPSSSRRASQLSAVLDGRHASG